MKNEVTELQAYRRDVKTESESRLSKCFYCGKEIKFGHIFCEEHSTSLNKQIYEFFSQFPKNKDGVWIRPRGEKLYQVIKCYLAVRSGLSENKRIIMKSCTGAGKSVMLDMMAFIEMTHFPNSLTIIGSISEAVSKMHIERLREWIGDSVFNRYMVGTQEATASKTEIKLAKLNSKVMAMPQSPKSRTGWHACVPGNTELLTKTGWKTIKDLNFNDRILTFNADSENSEWEKPLAIEKRFYDGKIYHLKQEKAEIIVTPENRMIYKTDSQQKKWLTKKISEVSKHHHFIIPSVGLPIEGKKPKTIRIKNKEYETAPFLKFLGYYISEGWCDNGSRNRINISQIEESPYFLDIKKNLEYIANNVKYQKDNKRFSFSDKNLVDWLKENCGRTSEIKHIPAFLRTLDIQNIAIFLRAYWNGDGGTNEHRVGTTSKQLADDIQYLFALIGFATTQHDRKDNRSEKFRDMHRVTRLISKVHWFSPEYINIVDYSDYVYSISVPNTYILIRYNNTISIIGNSLLLVDEIGRMEPSSYYASFSQMAAQGGTEVLASTPYLDSIVMQNIWASDDIVKIALEPEECFWIPKEVFRKKEDEYRIGGYSALYEQLYGAQFRSLTNRVIPDDLLLQSMVKGSHYTTSKNLIMGIDFGKSIDFTAIVVIDIETGDVKFVDTFQDDWPIQFAKIRKYVKEWDPIKIIADSSHIGDVILSDLRDLNIEGISMHNDILKKSVIDRLILAFFNNKLNIVSDEFPKLINEISSYVYYDSEHKKMGPSGRGHDDTVIALSLALRGLDVTSVSNNPLPDNLWSFTRVGERSYSDPWRISNV